MNQTTTLQHPTVAIPPRWGAAALWIAIVLLLSIALARIAVWLQSAHFAPVGLFPIMLGFAFGLAAALIAAYLGLHGRALITGGVIISALALVAAEHGFFYLDYRRQFQEKVESDLQNNVVLQQAFRNMIDDFRIQPPTLFQFMSEEASAKWLLWIADATAMIAIAAVVAWLMVPSAASARHEARG
jgi:hypothetical protein